MFLFWYRYPFCFELEDGLFSSVYELLNSGLSPAAASASSSTAALDSKSDEKPARSLHNQTELLDYTRAICLRLLSEHVKLLTQRNTTAQATGKAAVRVTAAAALRELLVRMAVDSPSDPLRRLVCVFSARRYSVVLTSLSFALCRLLLCWSVV